MRRGALPAGLQRLRRGSSALSSTGETMPIKSNYLFVVSMDVDPDKEVLFNEIYDIEHVPNQLKVPGVYAAARMRRAVRPQYRRRGEAHRAGWPALHCDL